MPDDKKYAIWFFFDEPITAASARKLGTALLTYSMNRRHEIKFKSYDRFFPNQDTMPKGGFGNLIAFPLQAQPRKNGNSVFIDEHLKPYPDQWEFLSSISKLSEKKVGALTTKLSAFANGNDLGILRRDDEESGKPWERTPVIPLTKEDFPGTMRLVKTNMIYILKQGISQRALNALKRLAAFRNPEFYKAQAMRMPTYNKPRIISCSDETGEYLCMPRGCEPDIMYFSTPNIARYAPGAALGYSILDDIYSSSLTISPKWLPNSLDLTSVVCVYRKMRSSHPASIPNAVSANLLAFIASARASF